MSGRFDFSIFADTPTPATMSTLPRDDDKEMLPVAREEPPLGMLGVGSAQVTQASSLFPLFAPFASFASSAPETPRSLPVQRLLSSTQETTSRPGSSFLQFQAAVPFEVELAQIRPALSIVLLLRLVITLSSVRLMML